MAPERLELPAEVQRSSVRFQKEYLLTAGDTLEVSVWRVPEASRVVVIRPDGNISLPLLQDVRAAGLTARELAEQVRNGLSSRLLNPEVAVIPQQVRQTTVYVLGDVRNPGGVPLRNAMTAAQALAAAGGPLRSGQERDLTLIRLADNGYLEAIPLAAAGWAQPQAYLQLATLKLQADDIIFVPEGGRSQIMRLLSDFLVPLQIYLNYRLITEAL
jgi:polysaccharide export outer membrane protein